MRKFIKYTSIVIICITIITILVFSSLILVAKKSIDYSFDENLFIKAKEDHTVYYYAYDSSSELVEVYKSSLGGKKEWTDFSLISDKIKRGFIAMEDRRFYEHNGVNYKRTAAAVINYFLKFRDSFGASTITQQLIKNISGDNEVNISRKINEILRALNLEKNHSKDDIFELYLNIIPMSGNIYGVGAASQIYFNKDPSDLSLAEAALIVGVTNAPSRYNPYTNPENCIEKRNKVLYAMLDVGFITYEEYNEARNTPLILSSGSGGYGTASWFVETANEEIYADIEKEYGICGAAARIYLNGAKIVLTMNKDIQDILDEYFSDVNNLSPKFSGGLKYSMVVSDPYTGNLLGIIGDGGKKNADKIFNFATAKITPGSVIKPLSIYAPLIDNGCISWSTIIEDSPLEYSSEADDPIPYPKNSPDIYEGNIDISYAIKKSKNTAAVKLLELYGAENAFNHLKRDYGFESLVLSEKLDSGVTASDLGAAPLALGQLTHGVSIRDLTEAYSVFPNDGVLLSGRSYTTVYDSKGNIVLNKQTSSKRLYKSSSARIMNQLLSGVVSDGTARQIRLKELVDVAGKTGTSGGDKDRLFVGYTPYFTAGIWCGYSKSDKAVGYNSPSHIQIWDEVMSRVHSKLVFDGFNENLDSFKTDGLIVSPYCSESGNIPTEECELDENSEIRYGYFTEETLPESACEHR